VGEAELGMAWNSAPYAISVSIVRRSNEIRDLSNAIGAQNFARLQFSYSP
jgi:lipid A 3-O-deacylase